MLDFGFLQMLHFASCQFGGRNKHKRATQWSSGNYRQGLSFLGGESHRYPYKGVIARASLVA